MAVSSNSGLLDFKTLLVPVIRAKTFLIVFVVFGVCLGIAHFLWASPEYKAKLVIIPEFDSGSSLLSGASDLAMMAGIRLGGDSEPTLYYKEILLSDLILDRVLHETYGNTDQPLLVALGFGKNLAEVEKAIRHLRKTTTVVRNNRTGIITMSVRSQDLVLSRSLANEMAKALDQFLLQSQSKTAGNQFDFLSQEKDFGTRWGKQAHGRIVLVREAVFWIPVCWYFAYGNNCFGHHLFASLFVAYRFGPNTRCVILWEENPEFDHYWHWHLSEYCREAVIYSLFCGIFT